MIRDPADIISSSEANTEDGSSSGDETAESEDFTSKHTEDLPEIRDIF